MYGVFDPVQRDHVPAQELHNGGWMPHSDVPARADMIVAALPPLAPAQDFGLEPILAVHDPDYIEFLRTGYQRWQASGRPGQAIGYTWPVVARQPRKLDRIDALLGRFSFDAATPLGPGTWEAVYGGAQTALTALQAVLDGRDPYAFALCRPPGHHAGADYLGGYCYLNNAAIAAEAATRAGRRVAVLDVDYHHGNGTQDIFWRRGDVFFASIHADPATDYPFFWGHADEVGEDAGAGATLNLPLPQGTDLAAYMPALETALARIGAFGADLLIVSFGADTFEGDPISHFAIRTEDYRAIASRIAELGLPVLIVMEGGYAVDALGDNVASFLSGFDAAA
ncbi:histone deacetylase family protein [Sphingomonas crusticola]|uniref:histone deacetylase family protein n=1 Tax=Sphingomonas crusticola TaxID=1697973 RepID=UPI000E21F0F6|nr:histone deacetylase family protein [Sphingomonas crusticola]